MSGLSVCRMTMFYAISDAFHLFMLLVTVRDDLLKEIRRLNQLS